MSKATSDIPFLTAWWFNKHNRRLWNRYLIRSIKPPIESYLEIGVCEGHSMRWVLEKLQPTRAVGVDPYIVKKRSERKEVRQHEASAKLYLAEWLQSGVLTLDRRSSWDYLIDIHAHRDEHPPFDLVYIDGDHRCLPAANDCFLAWPLVKMGGIMIMDDFDRRYQRGWPMSREGILAFLNAAEKTYDILWGEPFRRDVQHVAIRKTFEH